RKGRRRPLSKQRESTPRPRYGPLGTTASGGTVMKLAAALTPGVEIALRLRLACEAHDPSIEMHLDRVSRYACEIGRLMGFNKEQILELHYATPLHDVGKIGIP